MVVKTLLTSTTIVLNHFAEGAKSRPTILLDSRTKKFTTIQLTRFVSLH